MKIYILSLMVDQRYGSGNTTESQWISMDKAKIEKKKETEWKKLLSYFNIGSHDGNEIYDEDGTLYVHTESDCVKCVSDYCKQYNIETKRASGHKHDWVLEAFGDHDMPINGWKDIDWDKFEKFVENRKCGHEYTQRCGTKIVCGCDIKNPILKGDTELVDILGSSHKMYSTNNPEEELIRELERKGDICYYNTDLDSFPSLTIEEVKVTNNVKEF